MKKILILFVVIVAVTTWLLTLDNEFDESKVVTEEELIEYKQSLIESSNKFGYTLTEEEMNERIQNHTAIRIGRAKENAEGMEFKEALILSLKIYAIIFIVIGIIIFCRREHYNGLFKQ